MKKNKIIATILIFFLLFSFSPIGSTYGEENKKIITSFYPIYAMVKNLTVNIDTLEVENLAQEQTGCLHDYQLTTQNLKTLSLGHVLALNGAGMETFLEPVFQQFPSLEMIDASEGIVFLLNEQEHHHHEEDDHEEEHEVNPHIWLDVNNAIIMVENLSKGLQKAFPKEEREIQENEKSYVEKLKALNEEVIKVTSELPKKEMVTFHEAFPYFAKAYGLEVVAIITQDPEESLNPKELVKVIKSIESHPGVPLFVEPQYESLAAQTISNQTGSAIYTLDPLVTANEEDVLEYYIEGMKKNLEILQEAMK